MKAILERFLLSQKHNQKIHQLIFYLLLVLLPVQLGYHTWPAWAMVLGRRVDFLSPTLYLTDILIILIIIFWRRIKFPKFFLILPVFAAINIFFATNRMVAGYAWLKVLEYAFLALYIIQTKPKCNMMVRYLSIGVLYSSFIAIGQFLSQHTLGFWLLGERSFAAETPGVARYGTLLRAYSTFPHPNVLGGCLAIMIPLVIIQLSNYPIIQLSKTKRTFYILTVIFGCIALVLTFSRSAWIAMMIGITLIKKKYIILLIVCVVLIMGTVGLRDESVVVRHELNASAITMFLESPIIGKGLGNFLVELPNHLVSRQIYFLQPVHNIFLLVLSETGIIGLAIFLWIIWKAIKNNKMLIVLLFLGLVDHYPLTLQQGQLLLTLLLSSTIAL